MSRYKNFLRKRKMEKKTKKQLGEAHYLWLTQVAWLVSKEIEDYIREEGYNYQIEGNGDELTVWFVCGDGGLKLIAHYKYEELLYLVVHIKEEKKEMLKKIDKFISIEKGENYEEI